MIVRRNDSAKELAGHVDYNHRVGVAIPLLQPNELGLPANGESEQLHQLEDALVTALESGQKSILVLVITTGGMREFVFYTKDPDSTKTVIENLQKTIASHEMQTYVAADHAWETYKTFSRRKFPS